MCKISVIITTYNHRDFILETLDSVFAQTLSEYEVIVINDGSSDDTEDLLLPLARAGRIRNILQDNSGPGAARNRGIAEARGEFIALLDDDDIWPPDKLQWQIAAIQKDSSIAVVYGFFESFGHPPLCRHPGNWGPDGWVLQEVYRRNWIKSPGQTLIRASAVKRVGGFDTSIWGADDWDLWIRLAEIGRFNYVPKLALLYRQHHSNASKDIMKMYINSMKVLHKNQGSLPNFRNWHAWISAWRFILSFSRRNALDSMQQAISVGDSRKAVHMWLVAQRFAAAGSGTDQLLGFLSGQVSRKLLPRTRS
ncbi:glycosyltransferase family 2 protein [Desulfoferrobacter suflitae]|uniref:glycosyltransferase family 2 protein n=1 Tax=Desulfoferrobacter suflitae TaxID=2865782 RepID=UPI0021649A61|nr:glycosyltransferase family A protein [Desulfoferrobacter suflitae]MCK8600208.1 glycosyltransferase family 2 protein [Desulfoferrobacter suflitae]